MDTHPIGECCIPDCFVSQCFDIIHTRIPPVTHWSLFTSKALALTLWVGAPYLWAKLENRT